MEIELLSVSVGGEINGGMNQMVYITPTFSELSQELQLEVLETLKAQVENMIHSLNEDGEIGAVNSMDNRTIH